MLLRDSNGHLVCKCTLSFEYLSDLPMCIVAQHPFTKWQGTSFVRSEESTL